MCLRKHYGFMSSNQFASRLRRENLRSETSRGLAGVPCKLSQAPTNSGIPCALLMKQYFLHHNYEQHQYVLISFVIHAIKVLV